MSAAQSATKVPAFDCWHQLLEWRAARHPDRLAYVELVNGEIPGASLTYARLMDRTRRLAAWLQQQGVAAGDRALIFLPSSLDYIASFFACLSGGVLAVPGFPPRPHRPVRRLGAMAVDSGARWILTSAALAGRRDEIETVHPEFRPLDWLAVDTAEAHPATVWSPVARRRGDVAFLQYTSGSTTAPRGVMVTHGNILHNCRMLQQAFFTGEETPMGSWLPMFHDMGLIGTVCHSAFCGTTYHFMSPEAFYQRPARWLQAVSRYRAFFSGAPNFAYDLSLESIPPAERGALDLSGWASSCNGAETVRASTVSEFIRGFAPSGFRPETMAPSYGLAEATLIATCSRDGAGPVVAHFDGRRLNEGAVVPAAPGDPAARALVGCGRPLAELQLRIVDPESLTACRPDRIGEIWLSGPSVAQGYWGRTEQTAATFGARLGGSGEGPFLRTGDLGFIWSDELFVAGRIKDVIIDRGMNHFPQDIELTATSSHPLLRANGGAAVAVEVDGRDRLVVLHEVKRNFRNQDLETVLRAIRWAVAEEHGLMPLAVALVRPHSLPRTSSGKIMRHACCEHYVAGEFQLLAEWIAPGGRLPHRS